ncbi:cathepsin L1-like isoform X1 [Octopus sinensis]|uniref:Cathepsin L1-like isoform X1 n=1 Tax=Octopus sinensis TaxID=2607531 RepID=A0A6P7SRG7_9MOLL|nr:cathepsin L1-like isoform X1 [Octopus sinensis]
MMLPLLTFIIGFTLVSAKLIPNDENWELYKSTFRKEYRNAETENFRRAIWKENGNFINQHNLEADMGIHTFWMDMNEYADLSNREFVEMMNGFLPQDSITETFVSDKLVYLPRMVDWRQHGYVTGVKNQGKCGSCWAFSATGSLEGQIFRKYGKLISLSEQNLVDCSSSFGSTGCDGGLMDQAFRYIRIFGIESEISYPYRAMQQTCWYNRSKVVAFDTNYVDVLKTEQALQIAVANVGPVSASIDASPTTFQFYSHGVYVSDDCNHKLNHGILVVGYGTENGQDYWLVKNSWGERWGHHGYIKMARNRKNMCSIASLASYPLV